MCIRFPIVKVHNFLQQFLSVIPQIHSVGINEELLVSHSNSNFWSMTPEDVANGDAPFISYLPWSSVSSSDPNVTMMTSYCHGILNYILANPGVPMVRQNDTRKFDTRAPLIRTLFLACHSYTEVYTKL